MKENSMTLLLFAQMMRKRFIQGFPYLAVVLSVCLAFSFGYVWGFFYTSCSIYAIRHL